jgi:phosphate starvation-inducible membrane PsiE
LRLLQQIAKMLSALKKQDCLLSLLFFFPTQNKNNYSIVSNVFYWMIFFWKIGFVWSEILQGVKVRSGQHFCNLL